MSKDLICAFTVWVAAIACGYPVVAEDAEIRPNIILNMYDDMDWSDIGCHGGEVETPHQNRLAAKGVRLPQFDNNARCTVPFGPRRLRRIVQVTFRNGALRSEGIKSRRLRWSAFDTLTLSGQVNTHQLSKNQ